MIRADKINRNYFYPDQFRESAADFLTAYKLEKEISCPDSKNKEGLKDKRSRVCRFCHRKYQHSIVTFSNDAHVFSELLGNRYLVSDFECDECNFIFSKYESDLANFLGIVRTVQSVKAKKIPKFKSADKKLEAESTQDDNEGNIIKIRRFDGLNTVFQFDEKKQETIITYEKNPFTPLNVYKSILKMALSIVDDRHLEDYKFAFEYLRTNNHDDKYSGFALINSYSMPLTFQYEQPAGMLFRKTNNNDNLFTHVFSFSALNQIFQIVLPFNRQDVPHYTVPGGVNVLWCPPLFDEDNEAAIRSIHCNLHNLNSTERLRHQKESFVLPGQATYGESFDGSKIIGIDLIREEDNECEE
ncbi:hypothetical protein A4H97_24260 [Niastella yeongjuensis]|uniref:HNH endonuclease 5 domain-containing protein n=1 Tax=Niastella yeongjuensis TaxID=354355 RepID=A0A1V9F3I7_9BACT|nr:hypothetical protein [Niastella yeongjuensis]OQP52816.1 hypothetical protein A4H97_24260 [Niastella yeongjuensis]SEP20421.1 hypothetical protein SAMN05660816_04740 [Niastella yeongjuensis]